MILELVLQLLLQTIAKKKVLPWHIYTTHDGCGVQKKRGGGKGGEGRGRWSRASVKFLFASGHMIQKLSTKKIQLGGCGVKKKGVGTQPKEFHRIWLQTFTSLYTQLQDAA